MSENRSIAWKHLAVESAAIVASILLAFAIDAWWSDVQQTRELRTTLASFEGGFREHLTSIDLAIEKSNEEIETLQSFLLSGPEDNVQISDAVDLQRFLFLLFRPGTFDVNDSVLVATLDAHSLLPLNSPPLEAAIAIWLGEIAELQEARNALRISSQDITLALSRHDEVRKFMAQDREDREGISAEAMQQLYEDQELVSHVSKKLVTVRFHRLTLRTLKEYGAQIINIIDSILTD